MKLLFMYAAHCIGMVHIVNEKFVQEKTIFGLNFGIYIFHLHQMIRDIFYSIFIVFDMKMMDEFDDLL